jgi:hypothetical protein
MVHYTHCRERFGTGIYAVTKWSETHPNMSLESNGVDWARSLWKTPIWIRPHQVVHDKHCWELFCNGVCAVTIWSKTHLNMSLGSNGVDWTCSLWKILIWNKSHDVMHYWEPFHTHICAVLKWSKKHPNISQSLMDWIGRVRCDLFWFGFDRTMSCITSTIGSSFAPVFVLWRNGPNTTKY